MPGKSATGIPGKLMPWPLPLKCLAHQVLKQADVGFIVCNSLTKNGVGKVEQQV